MTDAAKNAEPRDKSNPFPAFSNTEYELFRAMIREEARKGAESAIGNHLQDFCAQHRQRTEDVETVVFGRTERGIVGLDQRTAQMERVITEWEDERKWFKRMLYAAITVAVIGLIVTLVQFWILGN